MIQRRFADAPNAAHPALVAVVALVLDANCWPACRRPEAPTIRELLPALSFRRVRLELIAEPQSFEG
jgi:hypothetical protein